MFNHELIVDACEWPVFDMAKNWPKLLPLIRQDKVFGDLLAQVYQELHHEDTGGPEIIREVTPEQAWQKGISCLSTSDWYCEIPMRRMHTWINSGTPDAIGARVELGRVLEDSDEAHEIWEKYAEQFEPTETDPDFLRATGRGHDVTMLAHRAAELWFRCPAGVVVGPLHSTVLVPDRQVVFDWLDRTEEHWPHPIQRVIAHPGWSSYEDREAAEKAFSDVGYELRKHLAPSIAKEFGVNQSNGWLSAGDLHQVEYRAAVEALVARSQKALN